MTTPEQFNEALHCGAKNRSGGRCLLGKGWGTAHVGRGRCKLHGGIKKHGDRRIKTGLFSPYMQGALREPYEHIQKTRADLMDLSPHLELLNTLLGHLMRERKGSEAGLIDWYNRFGGTVNAIIESNDPGEVAGAVTKLKAAGKIPAGRLDIDGMARLIKDIGALVEKMHRMKQTTSVTLEAVSIYAERLLLVVFRHVKDKDLLSKLKDDWQRIGIDMDQGHPIGD